MKRTITGIAAAALVVSALAPAAFADTNVTYTDISGNFAAQDIISLSDQGFIHGYSDGQFKPNQIISRGQFLAYFLNVVRAETHVEPIAHQQFFRDIPPRNWDYNYVGAAEAAGWIKPYWINVRLGGNFNENYQASWGDAASFYVAAMESSGKLQQSTLTSMHMSPLQYTKSIGLFDGIPSTENQIYLDRASAAVVLYNIWQKVQGATVPAGTTLSLTGNAAMAVNTSEQLTATLKAPNGTALTPTSAITYTTNSTNAFVSQTGVLVATQPGTYQITATVDGIQSAPLTVTVAGMAAGVKLSAASPSMVADGTATDTITAQIVDANGNPVTNFNGTMEFTDTNNQLVAANGTLVGAVTSVPVVNGVATIQVKSTSQLGVTDTITGTDIIPTGGTELMNGNSIVSATATVVQQQQIATSLKVVPASATVENNQPTVDGFTVQVLDQSGQPMLTGTYQVNLAVSGPGAFTSGTPAQTAYIGDGQVTSAIQGSVTSEQGANGTITITATGPNLQAGTGTIQSIVVGSPVAVKAVVAPTSTGSIVAGSSGGAFDLYAVDQNGNVVTDNSNSGFKATILQNNQPVSSTMANVSIQGNEAIVTGTMQGNYTLQVTSSDNLTPANVSFAIVPGAPAKAVITSPSSELDLPYTNNTTNIVAQLEDAYGNPVAEAGVPIQFTVATKSGSDTATLGGSTAGVLTLNTGSNGQASVPFVGSHMPGDSWAVGIDQVNGNGVSVTPAMIKMVNAVPTQMKLTAEDTSSYTNNNPVYLHSTTSAQAGDTVTLTVAPVDSYGNPSPNGDLIQVTLSPGLINPTGLTAVAGEPNVYTAVLPASGTLTFNATAAQSGQAQVTATDLSVPGQNLTGSLSMQVVPGNAVGAALFTSNGQEVTATNPLAVQSNVPVELFLRPVDSEGNPVIWGNAAQNFVMSDGNQGGQFRLSATGANSPVIQLPAGSSGLPVYYVNGASVTVNLSAAVQTSSN